MYMLTDSQGNLMKAFNMVFVCKCDSKFNIAKSLTMTLKKRGKALTGMQALCHGGGLDQVAFTHVTGDEVVEFLD